LNHSVPDSSPVIVVGNFPALNNDEDNVTLFDFSRAQVDSMAYRDARSGYSYELISPEMRGKSSDWDICADSNGATPGKRNSIYYAGVSGDEGSKNNLPSLTVDPNPFTDAVTLSYHLPFPVARVNLYIYDRRGRLIAKIRDAEESGSEWIGVWDGRSNGAKLPAGPYILNLEALDKHSGNVSVKRKTIVIGRKL